MIKKEFIKNTNSGFIELKFYDEYILNSETIVVNNLAVLSKEITLFFFRYLESYNIQTCFFNESEQKNIILSNFEKVDINLKVINNADKKISEAFNISLLDKLNSPIFEFYHQNNLDYPLSEHHLTGLKMMNPDDSKNLIRMASKVNVVLKSFFHRRDFELAELNLSFGKVFDKYFILSSFLPDEISLIPVNNKGDINFIKITNTNIFNIYSNYKNLVLQNL